MLSIQKGSKTKNVAKSNESNVMSVRNGCLCVLNSNQDSINFNLISGFKIVFFNVRSLAKPEHLAQVKSMLLDNDIDILGITETWLTNENMSPELSCAGFEHWRHDRIGQSGGGVAMYARKSDKVSYEQLNLDLNGNCQDLRIRVSLISSKPFEVVCMYRPPDSCQKDMNTSDDNLFSVLEQVCEQRVILGGDFNKDIKRPNDKQWFTKIKDLGLKQLITNPTRISAGSESCIDHIYVNDTARVGTYGTLDTALSDHRPVFISIKHQRYRSHNRKTIIVNQWNRFQKTEFDKGLAILKESVLASDCIDKSTEKFTEEVLKLKSQCLPTKNLTVKTSSKIPYVTKRIKRMMTKRDKLKKRSDQLKIEESVVKIFTMNIDF